jgi:hypothetical protein
MAHFLATTGYGREQYVDSRLILSTTDFVVTIPFSFIAEKFGVKVVLWCNLVPRLFMSAVALAVGASSFTVASGETWY